MLNFNVTDNGRGKVKHYLQQEDYIKYHINQVFQVIRF